MTMSVPVGSLAPIVDGPGVTDGRRNNRCGQCGGLFRPPRRTTLYCSPECRRAAHPPVYKDCAHCGVRFGPVDHRDQKYCGVGCKYKARRTGRKVVRRTHTRARSAQSLLAYHIKAGHVTRPAACEACGATGRRIEGAHYTYAEPLRVRWLCVSCHRRWDHAEPKGATYRVVADPPAA